MYIFIVTSIYICTYIYIYILTCAQRMISNINAYPRNYSMMLSVVVMGAGTHPPQWGQAPTTHSGAGTHHPQWGQARHRRSAWQSYQARCFAHVSLLIPRVLTL